MSKDLQMWGREKARSRYEGGGAIPIPRPRPDIEGAARQELSRRMKDNETFSMPDNQGSVKLPYVPPHEEMRQQNIRDARSGLQNIKRGGRIK